MHYARRQPVEEAANGAREDKYMACTRFSKVRRGEERETRRRNEGKGAIREGESGKERRRRRTHRKKGCSRR